VICPPDRTSSGRTSAVDSQRGQGGVFTECVAEQFPCHATTGVFVNFTTREPQLTEKISYPYLPAAIPVSAAISPYTAAIVTAQRRACGGYRVKRLTTDRLTTERKGPTKWPNTRNELSIK
jgi:hypothetical protein